MSCGRKVSTDSKSQKRKEHQRSKTLSPCCSTTTDNESVLRFHRRQRVCIAVRLQGMSRCCRPTADNGAIKSGVMVAAKLAYQSRTHQVTQNTSMATLPQHMVRPCAPTVVCDGAGEMPKPCLVEPPWGVRPTEPPRYVALK